MASRPTRRDCLKAASAATAIWLTSSAPTRAHGQTAESPSQDATGTATGPLDVGTRKQLFFDKRFIAESDNVAIAMNPPAKLGAVMKPDRPWEDFRYTSYFTTVDDGSGTLRMYYSCFDADQWHTPRAWEDHAFLCMAESKDGIQWEKPNLGVVDYKGSKENNIVLRSVVDGTVFVDPTASADRRFKLLHTVGPHKGGLRVSYSADGVRFATPEKAVSEWTPDSQQNAFYDPDRKRYLAYLRARPNMGVKAERRSVVRLELEDIEKPWPTTPPPQIVFAPDEHDPTDIDFYTNACIKYPYAADAYFMFPALYHHYPKEYGNDGLLDSSAAVSRDGIAWRRPDRRPYVSLGVQGEWDDSFQMMGVGLVRVGDRLLQYYNGTDMGHGGTREQSKEKSAGRTRWGWQGAVAQRLDGFYSADAGYAGGHLVTPPIRFSGSKLELNIDCSSAGNARVAILDAATGEPIPGFGEADCDTVMGNHVRCGITWKGKNDLETLRGKAVKLRVAMRSAKLYAFQFV